MGARQPVSTGPAGLPVPNSTKSYWHTEPSEKLLGHRTTPELPATADIVIVGSGMTGSWAAHFLKHGKAAHQSVVMLEAREACWGATGRNGGHCQPFLYGSPPEVARFELETYWFLRNFVAEHGIDCSWRSLNGVHAFLTQDLYDLAAADVERIKKELPDLADKITAVSPTSSGEGGGLTLDALRVPSIKGAIVQQLAASLWPYKLVCWVLERLLAIFPAPSFNLQTTTPVTSLQKGSGDYPWTVQTPRGSISAKTVLLATNAYTSHLLPAFADLIVPVRGQVGALIPPTEPAVDLGRSYVVVGAYEDAEGEPVTRDEYLVQRPLPGGELILGGGRHLAAGLAVGEWRDDVVEEKVAAHLRDQLEPWLDLRSGEKAAGEGGGGEEEKKGLAAKMEWTGIMGYSLDRSPWVGPVPEGLGGGEGLWLCGGYTGHGMPHAALCARGVVRMITGEKGHGVPGSFVVSGERVQQAREVWGDIMSTELKGIKALFALGEATGKGQNPETAA
ncbi:tRNA 5-methylaminomethyl-2-thiouridine biosynthesis bifunctional protein MnmC [Pleurostoma richardsiae]|uniref:tRNA 5-methylaminomethyl-2-thiouridine biosynthesis bifunctional protein MnmC n=1 Tax=Pleurostoma richardsiae TaxID=41990 RepID=A0AA38RTC1_9PEZI|nr:tRNA 5-methylaminomethyl-2-thiouridine biosynthesis bifunctional protein MnmC [Pleurostoma richardsiae]